MKLLAMYNGQQQQHWFNRHHQDNQSWVSPCQNVSSMDFIGAKLIVMEVVVTTGAVRRAKLQ